MLLTYYDFAIEYFSQDKGQLLIPTNRKNSNFHDVISTKEGTYYNNSYRSESYREIFSWQFICLWKFALSVILVIRADNSIAQSTQLSGSCDAASYQVNVLYSNVLSYIFPSTI